MSKAFLKGALVFAVLAFAVVAFPGDASANHSWGNYHWARTANPFTLLLGDNVNTSWDAYLATTSADWSVSSVLNTSIVAGGTRPKNCRATAGRIEVCNARYGNNGWLGLAQIWASGSHITQATAKLNDTYFNTSTYNTPPWRNVVMCQEVAHGFGLDHQDENFSNADLGTCMDYSNNPVPNQHPNAHDYEQLETIYGHLDSTTTVGSSSTPGPLAMYDISFDGPQQWGRLVETKGNSSTYVLDFGAGHRVITHVFWVPDAPRVRELHHD